MKQRPSTAGWMLSAGVLLSVCAVRGGEPRFTDPAELTYAALYDRAWHMEAPPTTIERRLESEGNLEAENGTAAADAAGEAVVLEPAGNEAAMIWTHGAPALAFPEKAPDVHAKWRLTFRIEALVPFQYRVFALEDGRFQPKGHGWRDHSPTEPGAVDEVICAKKPRRKPAVDMFGGLKVEVRGNNLAGRQLVFRDIAVRSGFRDGCFRREVVLPDEELWSAVAYIGNRTLVWINGREVKDVSVILPRPVRKGSQMYEAKRVSLLPYLRPGRNVVAVQSAAWAYFRAAAVTVSGDRCVMDSGPGWRWATDMPPEWVSPAYNDSEWKTVPDPAEAETSPVSLRQGTWRLSYRRLGDLPPYDGLIRLENPYEAKFFYSATQPFRMDAAVPAGLAARRPRIEWRISRYDGKRNFTPVTEALAAGFRKDGTSLRARVTAGAPAGGVYVFESSLVAGDGTLIEAREPEPFVVVSKARMTPVAGDTLEQGMRLEHERTIDFTDPDEPCPWMETDARARLPSGAWTEDYYHTVEPALIVERNGLRYRETRTNTMAQFTYQVSFEHPGDWYLMVLEYPDDGDRWMGVACNTSARMNAIPSAFIDDSHSCKCGPSIWTGDKYPNTGKMLEMKWLYRPNPGPHGINVISLKKGGTAAAARLRMYRIAGSLPELDLGDAVYRHGRRFGTLSERTSFHYSISGYYNYCSVEEKLIRGAGTWDKRAMCEACKGLALQLDAARHWAEYMRFAGQNVHIMGCYQYTDGNTCPQLVTGSPRLHPNARDVAARVFRENDLGFYASIEFGWTRRKRETTAAHEDYFVDSEGKRSTMYNFLRPEFQQDVLDLVRQLTVEFKDQPNFLGINWIALPGRGGRYWSPTFIDNPDYPLGVGYDDFTVGLFEKETGVAAPTAQDDPERFGKRYTWLTSPEMRPQWVAWRASKVHDFFVNILDTCRKIRPDLECVVNVYVVPTQDIGEDTARSLRDWGWDVALLGDTPGLRLMPWISGNAGYGTAKGLPEYAQAWQREHDRGFYAPFAEQPRRALMVRYGWLELQQIAGHFPRREGWPRPYQLTVMGQVREELAMEPFTQGMIGLDPQLMAFGFTDCVPYVGIEDVQRKFARVFMRLPPARSEPVLKTGLDTNFALRTLRREGKYYLLVANPGYWPITGEIALANAPKIRDLVSGKPEDVNRIAVSLPPFGLAAYVADAPGAEVTGWSTDPVPNAELAHMRGIIERANEAVGTRGMKAFLGDADYRLLEATARAAARQLDNGDYAAAWHALTQAGFWHALFERTRDARYADNIGPKELIAVRAPNRPVIDGVLDDGVWKSCIGRTRFVKNEKELSEFESWVYAAWADDRLYLAFDYRDPHPDKIKSTADTGNEHDFWSSGEDYLAFFIKTSAEDYYQFAVNAANFHFDQACSTRGLRNYAYAPDWKSASAITETGWTAEIEIDTLDAFRKTPAVGDAWEINFHRFHRDGRTACSSWVWNPGDWHSSMKEENQMGRLRFAPANLHPNPSAERLENGTPAGWHTQAGRNWYAFAGSDDEQRTGQRSVGLTLLQDRKPAASIMTPGDGELRVHPNTTYAFSFWMKSTAPTVHIAAILLNKGQQKTFKHTSAYRCSVKGDGWRLYEGTFKTEPTSKSAVLMFFMGSRAKSETGAQTSVPPGTAMYIDDLLIHEL